MIATNRIAWLLHRCKHRWSEPARTGTAIAEWTCLDCHSRRRSLVI
ncbi:MAG: hypothetical protein ACR2HN_12170 [Tepidiformaceae bacterium]